MKATVELFSAVGVYFCVLETDGQVLFAGFSVISPSAADLSLECVAVT